MRDELTSSFIELAEAEIPGLRRLAYALTRDWHRADDLVQGAFERLYAAWRRVHAMADPGAYLRKTLVRHAISESRRPWRREEFRDVLPEAHEPDHAVPITARMDLADALAGLTPKQRAIIVMRYIEDRSVDDVAEILGIAPGTVKRQAHDGLAHLRNGLAAAGESRDLTTTDGEMNRR